MATQKKYRVNQSEMFNLDSMRTKVKCIIYDMEDKLYDTVELDGKIMHIDDVEEYLNELESIMEKAWYVGALVDWPTLKRIREIKAERQIQRYATCLANGMEESKAAYAFTD